MKHVSQYFLCLTMLCLMGRLQAQTDFSAADDSYVNSSQSTTNYGSATAVVTKISTNSRYAFFKFDLSTILGDSVSSAVLKLNVKSVSANSSRSVYAVSDDTWDESTLTWDNQSVIGSELENISISTGDDEKYVFWDISSYVASEVSVDGVISIAINDPGADGSGIDFYTKEQGTTKAPILTVTSVSTSTNEPPTTSITSPINGDNYLVGSDITISAEASDTDGTISKLEFYEGTTRLGEDLTSPYSFTWRNVSTGNYNLTTVATDDLGATGTSSIVSVNVSSSSSGDAEFVHPGGLFKQSDLERMRYMVEGGMEPYATSFNELQSEPKASYNYVVQGDPTWTEVNRGGLHGSEFEADATAAYLNALMWAITGDSRHADKCVEIFNTWKNLTDVEGTGGTYALNAGLFAWKLVEAAEIIKSTYTGWSVTDIQQFKDMLVYPGYSDTAVPAAVSDTNGTFYWRIYNGDPGRHGNQDMIAWRAMITMGVFLDNRKMYDRALRYFSGLSHRSDDIPYHSGPSPSGAQLSDNTYFTNYQYLGSEGTIQDYGYNGVLKHYIWENGQNQESSRDQQHGFFGLGIAAGIAEVAWNQGDTVWNVMNNRLLKGFEFLSRYNTSYIASYQDQPNPWEPTSASGEFIQRKDRTGRWYSKEVNPYFESDFTTLSRGDFPGKRPVYEQAWAHFNVRMGLGDSAVWTKRGRDVAISNAGYEKTGFSLDHAGWGALCFRRPLWAAGDPISGFIGGVPNFQVHDLPTTMEAENYDFFPDNGEGRTYHDLTTTNSGGNYRYDGVDIQSASEGGFALTDLDSGEWVSFTTNVSQAGTYQIDVRYAATNSTGTIQFLADSADITGHVNLPATGGVASWATHTVSNNVVLGKGIHVFRIYVGGIDDSYNLNSFTVSLLQGNQAPTVSITSPANGSSSTEGSSTTITADATDADGTVAKVEFYLGSDKIGEDAQSPYELTWNYLPVGTYDLTATATDSDGAIDTSAVVSITVKSGNGSSQTTNLSSSDDSYVHSANTTTNYGSNTSVVTKWSASDNRYAFYKFDLSTIDGAVSLATLKLNVKSISANSTRSSFKVNTDSWSESTLTYANQPAIGSEISNVSITNSQNGTYVEWDVTNFVAVENGLDRLVTFCINDIAATNTGIDFYTKESPGNEPVLTVIYKNEGPSVSITSPEDESSFFSGANVTITADASTTNSNITMVEFFQATTKLGEDSADPYSFTWSNVPEGYYNLTAVATDNTGAKDTSDIVSINVNASALNIGSVYKIIAIHSSKVMAIKDANTSNNIEAVQQSFSGATHQQWELVDGGSGLYKLKAVHSNKFLEIKDSKSDSGIEAVQNSSTSSNNQKWDILDIGGGNFKIVNENSGLALGVEDNKQDEDAVIRQYSYSGASSMQWSFELISSGLRLSSYEGETLNSRFKIYPNPTKNSLVVKGLGETGRIYIEILDLSGRQILSQQIRDSNDIVDLHSLRTGVYHLKVISNNDKRIETFKLIKQ